MLPANAEPYLSNDEAVAYDTELQELTNKLALLHSGCALQCLARERLRLSPDC